MRSHIRSTARWRKSSLSQPNGSCVALATDGEAVAMRDTKDPNGPVLMFEWDGLTALLRFASDLG